jgi:hypothetical protein
MGDAWPEVEHHEEATQYGAMSIHLIFDGDGGCQVLEIKKWRTYLVPVIRKEWHWRQSDHSLRGHA